MATDSLFIGHTRKLLLLLRTADSFPLSLSLCSLLPLALDDVFTGFGGFDGFVNRMDRVVVE